MKQHITKKQWRELSDEQVHSLLANLTWDIDYPEKVITIGQMIEFLGDDWFVIRNQITKDVLVEAKPFDIGEGYKSKELCDALFEAVKYKLNE